MGDRLLRCALLDAVGHRNFQAVSCRGDKVALILASNRAFGDWGRVFADPVVAADIIDRLLNDAAAKGGAAILR